MPRPAAGTGSAAEVVLCSGVVVVVVEVVKLLLLLSFSQNHIAEWCVQTAFQGCCAVCMVHPTRPPMCTWASSDLVVSHWVLASDCHLQPLKIPRSALQPLADCHIEHPVAHPCACRRPADCCCCCGCSPFSPSD